MWSDKIQKKIEFMADIGAPIRIHKTSRLLLIDKIIYDYTNENYYNINVET